MLLDLLIYRGKFVFAILMTWFEGELVFHLVYCILLLFCCISFISIYFTLYFTCQTSLYLVDYAYHYARMSRDGM
jgi:hypothetical protein